MFFKQRPACRGMDKKILPLSGAAPFPQEEGRGLWRFLNLQEKKLDVIVNSIPVFSGTAPGSCTGYITVRAGQNTIKLYSSDNAELLLRKTMSKYANEIITFAVISAKEQTELLAIPEEVVSFAPGYTAIRIISANTSAERFDINREDKAGGAQTLLFALQPYTVSDYLYLPARDSLLCVLSAAPGGECAELKFEPSAGQSYLLCIARSETSALYAKILTERF